MSDTEVLKKKREEREAMLLADIAKARQVVLLAVPKRFVTPETVMDRVNATAKSYADHIARNVVHGVLKAAAKEGILLFTTKHTRGRYYEVEYYATPTPALRSAHASAERHRSRLDAAIAARDAAHEAFEEAAALAFGIDRENEPEHYYVNGDSCRFPTEMICALLEGGPSEHAAKLREALSALVVAKATLREVREDQKKK